MSRADITFYGLDHSGPSYQVRIFADQPDADDSTPVDAPGYVGAFSVFGHGRCFGDEGHCDVRGPVTAFDRRLPHQLEPTTRVVICTDAVRRWAEADRQVVTLSLVPVVRASALAEITDADTVLQVDQVALHTYQ